MQSDHRVEEETVPNYNPSRYYPVQIRDIFQNRYEVLGKLGYGATSTTWFCRDHHAENFKVLKICIHESGRPLREQHAYSQFSGLRTSNIGYWFTRLAKKRFEVTGPSGFPHACFVFTPAACTIEEILKYHDGPLDMDFIKSTLRCAIRALDFLHSDAQLIHTDVKLDNMFMTLTDDAELEALACFMVENPPGFKVDETGRKIYQQYNLADLGSSSWGHAILGDLGEAYVFDEDKDDGLLGPSIVGPAALRPPESLLGMKWGTPLDIWQVGCLFFMLLNERIPFKNFEGAERWSGCYHLTQMTALMGPPPEDYLSRSEEQYLECDESCAWRCPGSKGVPDISFEALLEKLEGEDKTTALDFVRCIFQWKPEERSTAKELLQHPFIKIEKSDVEKKCAEEKDAEDEDAEDEDAEDTSAEETSAEERDAEEATVEGAGAEETSAEEASAEQTGAEETDAKKTDAEQTGAKEMDAGQTDAGQTSAEETTAEETSTKAPDPGLQCADGKTSGEDSCKSQKLGEGAAAPQDTRETQDVIDAGGESQQPSIHVRKTLEDVNPIKEEQSGVEPSEASKNDEPDSGEQEPEQIAADAKKDRDGEVVDETQIESLEKLADLQIGPAESLQQQ
ncbi:hypothetical protein KC361_g2095 [Hortaea werneckii]|nr:hypothetical protein KC361_g2095 [Hortaea werneckii]